jgi:hypothetical protein
VVAAGAGFILGGVGLILLAVFLGHEGLQRASSWSSVLVLFISIIAAAAGLWGGWMAALSFRDARKAVPTSRVSPSGSLVPTAGPAATITGPETPDEPQKMQHSGSTVFHIRAERDSYVAQQMTIRQVSDRSPEILPDHES